MPVIVLATLNARYSHSSLGLRYVFANLGDLQAQARICEFTLEQRPLDIAEQLLALQPRILGLGVYIWNVRETTELVAALKQIRPGLKIVLGGPEVSYECGQQAIVELADYVIPGAADLAFAQLCRALLAGCAPEQKILPHAAPRPEELTLPYRFYTDEDIAHRVVYVEASRGCPFKCEFCLSALDQTARPFSSEPFLAALDALWQRGARRFKFVDRTFNLKIEHSVKILEFFLARLDERTFLHFELIPDRLPEPLQEMIQRFPSHALQFEIGVQSFNPTVQALISRRQDNTKTEANLRFLRDHAHLHTDLIAGLPGEDLASFGVGFDRLVALQPHEIQVGILKRLRGAPIVRHTETRRMRYHPSPPYNVLSTDCLDFAEMQRLNRFARYWDVLANAGRFPHTRPLLLGDSPFARFLAFSDWLYAGTGQTHKISLERWFDLLYTGLQEALRVPENEAREALVQDFERSGSKRRPGFLRSAGNPRPKSVARALPERQARHR